MVILKNNLLQVLNNTWPIVLISVLVATSLRITYLIKSKSKFILHEELLSLIFIIYILMVFQIVTYQDVISYGNNFIPFKELTRYSIGTNLFFKNIIGNILLFMPYGFFASYYLKIDKKKLLLFLVFLFSLSIECVQLIIGRCFDVDDILLNLIGGYLGYLVYRLLVNFTNKMSERSVGLILITLIIIATIMFLYILV